MTDLNEKELQSVAGGASKEKTIVVKVDIPDIFNDDIDIKVYIDGELQSHLCKTVDCSVRVVNMQVHGKAGISQLKVKLNNVVTKIYEIDYDMGSYREI